MISLIIFFLAVYGLTMLVVQSSLFKPFREGLRTRVRFLHKLFTCMMCFGFWASVGLSWVCNFSVAAIYLKVGGAVGLLVSGFVGVTVVVALYLVQLMIEKKFNIEW
jgi:hypothetical protein